LRETITRVLRSYGLSSRGAGTGPIASIADPAAQDLTQGITQDITDTDFDAAAWQGEHKGLPYSGLRRVVVRELPPADASGEAMAVRAVIAPPSPTDRLSLQRLHDQGVRGLRFRLDGACDPQAILSWAERIVALGWHVEVELPDAADAPRLTDAEWALLQVPVPTCFFGLAGYLAGHEAEAAFLLELVEMGRFWLKLSGTEIATASAATREALQRLVNAAMTARADRLVWGSGPTSPREDLSAHIDMAIATLRRLLPDAASRNRVLWANPAALYGFS
jgi:predicted TIM-barrel fold metal-dependent hydrolase